MKHRLVSLAVVALLLSACTLAGRTLSTSTPPPGMPTLVAALAPVGAATEARTPTRTAQATRTSNPPLSTPGAPATVSRTDSAAPRATRTANPPLPTPEATPTPVSPPKQVQPTGQAVATAQSTWAVQTLLVGPGTPGRLYALQYIIAADNQPADKRKRLLISDDLGQTWAPFPGGLPVDETCLNDMNMDYAAADALYASTCQGLYRWSGAQWMLISPQETWRVAIAYQHPDEMWAIAPGYYGTVLRSTDGGHTWNGAGTDGFDVAIDPRNRSLVYAITLVKGWWYDLVRWVGEDRWVVIYWPGFPNGDLITKTRGWTIDGGTGTLYLAAGGNTIREGHLFRLTTQIWRTANPDSPSVEDVRWELVHDFGEDATVQLLASGASPQGLILYANIRPLSREYEEGNPVLSVSLDGGHSWTRLPIPEE